MLVCLSVSHKNALLPFLESLNIRNETAVAKILCSEGVKECIILQTCNRVEIYCALYRPDEDKTITQILKLWSTTTGVSYDVVTKLAKCYFEREAIEHLFLLASGLESMVLAEDQILTQVRAAFYKAKACGTSGPTLDRVFLKALRVGRQVRTETKINQGSVSIGSAAVDFASNELGDLKSKKVLVIGAGATGRKVAEALKNHGVSEITIANRTFEKSQILAKKISGKTIPFNDIFQEIPNSDLVIAAVSVTEPLFTEHHLSSFITGKSGSNRTLIIDISQPRVFEEKIGCFPQFRLKTLDDLSLIIADNLRIRELKIEQAKSLILAEVDRFELELLKLTVEPIVDEIYRRFERIRQEELERAMRKLHETDEKKLAILNRFSKELIERVAQLPIERLRKATFNNDSELFLAAERLFQVKD